MGKMEKREDIEAKRLVVKMRQQQQRRLTKGLKSSRCCNDIWRSSGPLAEGSERTAMVMFDVLMVVTVLLVTSPLQAYLSPAARSLC